jgi:hypothetical protein
VSGSGLALPHNETYLSKWELGRCPLHYVANPQLFTPETLAKRAAYNVATTGRHVIEEEKLAAQDETC